MRGKWTIWCGCLLRRGDVSGQGEVSLCELTSKRIKSVVPIAIGIAVLFSKKSTKRKHE